MAADQVTKGASRSEVRARAIPPALAVLAALCVLAPASAFGVARTEPSGRELYLEECAHCHGPTGRGDGPEAVYFQPPPRNLRSGFLEVYDVEEVVARLRDGTPLVLQFDAERMRQRVRQTETITAHLRRLPSIDWAKVDEGSAIFAERCEVCHGPFGRPWPATHLPKGVQKPPRDLWDPAFQRETSDAGIIRAIQHGHEAMPGIPGLQSPEQAGKLVPFIRVLSPGFELYSYYCAVCHGDDGRAETAVAPAEYKPRVVFDRAWLERKDEEQLRLDVLHMLSENANDMPHFREVLDEEQLRSIVEYLKRSG